jgi:hypothetical protein
MILKTCTTFEKRTASVVYQSNFSFIDTRYVLPSHENFERFQALPVCLLIMPDLVSRYGVVICHPRIVLGLAGLEICQPGHCHWQMHSSTKYDYFWPLLA